MIYLALLFPALFGLVWVARRRSTPVESSWTATRTGGRRAVVARADPPSPWLVSRALGRVEARELWRSVSFGVGLGFCVLLFVLFGLVFAGDGGEVWESVLQLAPWLVHPLVGMTVLAGHRAVTRSRRDGTDELFDSCPTDPVTRTAGFLAAAVTPVVALAIFLPGLFVASSLRGPGHAGPLTADNWAEVLAAIVLGAGGVALGVALGRWVAFPLAPVGAVFGVLALSLKLNSIGDPGWNPFAPLSTAPALSDGAPIFTDRPAWWHLLWILALTLLVAVVAVARHRRDRKVGALAVGGSVLLVAAFVGAMQPPARPASIVSLVAEPAAHQRCMDASTAVRLCAYTRYRDLLDPYVARLAPIAAALPSGSAPVTLRQVFDGQVNDLPPTVRRALPHGPPWLSPGEMRIGYTTTPHEVDLTALGLSLRSVGLPIHPSEPGGPLVVAGQARGVVALWLATRGLGTRAALALATARQPESADPFERGSIEKDRCATPSVVWSAQDLRAARALLAQSDERVRDVLHARWGHWVDPATGTDDLLAAVGLGPVGPFDHVTPSRPGPC